MKRGFVYIIGVGPGDPELLTIKAVKALEKAEVVVYGKLIPEEILKYATSAKEFIRIEKRHRREASKVVLEKALEGKIVAHLKNGDPSIYGGLMEEMEVLRRYNIPFEVIPGVSSITTAIIRAGRSLTDYSSGYRGFAVVNGHDEKLELIEELTDKLGLTVLLMPDLNKVEKLEKKYNVLIVINASRPNEKILTRLEDTNIQDPTIIYIFKKLE